ncbi:MAG: hypothetical protein D6719_01810 [Candidatus Dadabacteria bacterium]|nr:MAG: hypothetical protein D6719_01810 [Candidatus Dadabacteria bacterium]
MPLINFTGLASGIDAEALISATSDAARAQRVTPLEDKISELEDTNSSLEELKTKLTSLKSLLQQFTTVNGGAVAKLGKSTDETVVTATASNAASDGSYSITVTQLAKNATISFATTATTYTSATDVIDSGINDGAPDADRTIPITIGTGAKAETVNVVLTSTTTLNDFVEAFNNSTTKATAVVSNVGTSSSPDYRVIITSNKEGTEEGQLTIGAYGPEITAFDSNTTDPATDANFTLSGVSGTITRSTNTVSDLIPGVTFTLESVGGPTTITVATDVSATTSAVQDFIDAYNDIVKYLDENNQITRQEDGKNVTNIFGPLANTRVDDGVLTSLRGDMSGSTYSSGTQIKIFADLGITTERDGTLKFDTDTFEQALSDEPDSVKNILQNFGDTAAVTNGTIDQYIRFNGLIEVVTKGNTQRITDLNKQISEAEKSILRNEELTRQRFARLESLIGQLQSQQQALTSALAGLGTNIG